VKINEAYGLLNSAYIDWSPILVNPRGIRRGSQITWDNYTPQMLKLPVRVTDVTELFNDGQYTFQIADDGSLIQIYYQYDARGNELHSASLAFYSAIAYEQPTYEDEDILGLPNIPLLESEAELSDLDVLLSEEYSGETLDEIQIASLGDGSIGWLRIDYDPDHAKGVLHHDCHMHISAFPNARLVVDGIPNPRQFIEFIMALCYPGIYKEHRLDNNGLFVNEEYMFKINSNCVSLQEHNIYSQITHFRIPDISGAGRR